MWNGIVLLIWYFNIKAEERHKELLGHLMWAAAKVANELKLEKGWRLVVNDGVEGCNFINKY